MSSFLQWWREARAELATLRGTARRIAVLDLVWGLAFPAFFAALALYAVGAWLISLI
jgi:hypothetical protein